MDHNDTDAAFVAEADMDHKDQRAQRIKSRTSYTGEQVVVEAQGGIDNRFVDERGEEEPLLGNERQRKDSSGGAEWHGMAEFEGLPWYKRPSVC